MIPETLDFSPDCRRCRRLADYLDDVAARYPAYHARPVAPFGDPQGRLLIVGLAPGLHGANATGRPFTGDHAGIILYQTLHRYGFANRPQSTALDDGLQLQDCRITNAVKCLPPANKPTGDEVNSCNAYLARELAGLPAGAVVLALGQIAHRACVRALGLRQKDYPFAHAAVHESNGVKLVDSYHCSRYNTQTRRLTPEMFDQVFGTIRQLLEA